MRKLAHALATRLRVGSHGPPIELDPRLGNDDYDWSRYHVDYRAQLAEIESESLLRLEPGNHSFRDGVLEADPSLPPIHPNHACLYETIGVLAPGSVLEVGCGGGDHLHNLGVLFPDLQRRGIDRSPGQLEFLRERNPHVAALVEVLDVTLPPSDRLPQADVVYSQAVLMHIQAGNGHLVALANMFRMARHQVVLMENWKRHPFVDDIRRLAGGGMLAWEPRLHLRRYDGRPHLLVASREELDLEPLERYDQLVEAMDWEPSTAMVQAAVARRVAAR